MTMSLPYLSAVTKKKIRRSRTFARVKIKHVNKSLLQISTIEAEIL